MRYYDIEIEGGKSYTSRNNPNALNVELDISIYDADAVSGCTAVIWGIALQDISQATNLANKKITISGGMQQGLPLANAQAPEAGILIKGYIWQAFGNWVGTEMWLTLVMLPDVDPPTQAPAPNAPSPPPKNIVLKWTKGTMLADALKQTLMTAYPNAAAALKIGISQLVAPQDNIGYYENLRELNIYLRRVSQELMAGSKTYPGVGCCLQKGGLTVHDGTVPPEPKMIQFTDLIGQPTWIAAYTIQVKVVMRGDLKVSDKIKLPPTPVITTAAAQSGIPGPLTFSGTFTIQSLRHVGNFRQPDGAAWVTIIEALQGTN
jgi:hypothetical protein